MANPSINVFVIDPEDLPEPAPQEHRCDLASIDDLNSHITEDLVPLAQATEMMAQAVRVMMDLEAAAAKNPAIAAHLSMGCKDWRTPLLTVDDPLQTIIDMIRLTRRQADHLAELTTIRTVSIPNGSMHDVDPDAASH